MTWLRTHGFAAGLLGVYMAMMVYHAVEGKRRTRGIADYYVGGRALGGVALGLSFFATYSSTNSFVGFSGQAYTYGAPWLLLTPVAVAFCIIAWLVVAPRLRRFTASLDSLTIPDFIGFRFDSNRARVVAALIVLLASLLYMTAVFKGIGNLLELFLEVPYPLAIGLVLVIVMIYTAVGGFVSVVRTDVVQGIVMIVAAALLFSGTVRAAGGFEALDAVRHQPETTHLFRWDAAMAFPVLIGIVVAGTMKFVVEPRQLARFYALKDHRATRRGMWVSTLAFLVVYSLLLPVGLFARRIVPSGIDDTDLVVPTLLSRGDVFGPGAGAVLLVAMVAAAMSSLDSVLLVMASTCERDLVSVWRKRSSDRWVVRETQWYVALFAVITAVIALRPPGQIVTLTAFSGSLYAACFFPAIVLGLHWCRGNGAAVMASFAVGLAVLGGWRYLPLATAVHAVFPAMALSTLAYIMLAAVTTENRAPAVRRLFERDSGL